MGDLRLRRNYYLLLDDDEGAKMVAVYLVDVEGNLEFSGALAALYISGGGPIGSRRKHSSFPKWLPVPRK